MNKKKKHNKPIEEDINKNIDNIINNLDYLCGFDFNYTAIYLNYLLSLK